jgi:hypothetical protein
MLFCFLFILGICGYLCFRVYRLTKIVRSISYSSDPMFFSIQSLVDEHSERLNVLGKSIDKLYRFKYFQEHFNKKFNPYLSLLQDLDADCSCLSAEVVRLSKFVLMSRRMSRRRKSRLLLRLRRS